jgi:hypothetical protein
MIQEEHEKKIEDTNPEVITISEGKAEIFSSIINVRKIIKNI